VELARDALRARHLDATGEKAAWLAKAETVAAAARVKAAASAGAKVKAKDWAERNVAGAASEEVRCADSPGLCLELKCFRPAAHSGRVTNPRYERVLAVVMI
jgi:hypothetical protein